MAQSFKIDFRLIVGDKDDWISIDQLLGKSEYLVDCYMRVENLHCCDFQGGFFIDIDGKPWSDEGSVDEFWMTTTWLSALKDILDGQDIAIAHPWEESNLTITRKGSELELVDIHSRGHTAMPGVQVSLLEFVEQIIMESAKFARLVTEIKDEIETRRDYGVSDELEAKLKEIEQNLPEELELLIQQMVVRLEQGKE